MSENNTDIGSADEILHIADEYPLPSPAPMQKLRIQTSALTPRDADINNGYTPALEAQINKIYIDCQKNKILHEYSEKYCNIRAKLIGFPSKILNVMVASISTVNVINVEINPLFLGIIAITNSVLNVTEQHLAYETRHQLHKIYVVKFKSLISDIENNMVLKRGKRINGVQFLDQVTQKFISYSNGNSPSFCHGSDDFLSQQLKDNKINENITSIHELPILPPSP